MQDEIYYYSSKEHPKISKTKLVKLQSLVAKCCKIRKIQPCEISEHFTLDWAEFFFKFYFPMYITIINTSYKINIWARDLLETFAGFCIQATSHVPIQITLLFSRHMTSAVFPPFCVRAGFFYRIWGDVILRTCAFVQSVIIRCVCARACRVKAAFQLRVFHTCVHAHKS